MKHVVSAALILAPLTAVADAPRVSADIRPVHALVAQIMEGVGTPDLIVPLNASPHHHALRPSEASALSEADLVFWVGEGLTPWLEKPLETLATEAAVIELIEADGLKTLNFRETTVFEPAMAKTDDHDHDHDHDHEDHADHDDHDHAKEEEHAGHDDHDHDHDHDDHASHDDHDHAKEEDHAGHDHDHDHSGVDPHAWLSPANASLWAGVIAEALATADPAHADTYRANADAVQAEIAEASAKITEQLADMKDTGFVVMHDAYQYFETSFGLSATGAVKFSDANDPSPASIAALRDSVLANDVGCALSEPQFNARLLETVFDGTSVTLGSIDPLGSTLAEDASYTDILTAIGDSVATCLAPGS